MIEYIIYDLPKHSLTSSVQFWPCHPELQMPLKIKHISIHFVTYSGVNLQV